ncbi:hypothetical protein [Homoserinibacter gongjuensis]|uniref:DNA polymerase III subunit gamma/tau n=1 Tax=Homoserinibacter gongjuensis TaxID=1162968 RepID=A0ABQ6JPC1_9MICO|nr:hypothetical protein [Homoserinibacter gongjuensis]GMA89789.1 hypothetical protein GCM10025869_03180 [Homoserinibacter gongjuensis]
MSPRDVDPPGGAYVDDSDDEALHWAGDDARGQAAPRLRDAGAASESALAAPEELPEADVARSPAERALLAGTVAFGLLYLALSIGWISSAQLLVYPSLDLLGEIMWQFGEFLAMVGPALWFAAALTLTPEGASRRGTKRMLGLLAGALVLLPWPALLFWIGSMQ